MLPGPLQPLIESGRKIGGLFAFSHCMAGYLGEDEFAGVYLSVTLVRPWAVSVRLTPDAACHVCDRIIKSSCVCNCCNNLTLYHPPTLIAVVGHSNSISEARASPHLSNSIPGPVHTPYF